MASEADGMSAITALHHQRKFGRNMSVCWSQDCERSATGQQNFGPFEIEADDVTGKEINRQ